MNILAYWKKSFNHRNKSIKKPVKTATSKKLNIQKIISALVVLTGILLLIFMITVEDEPGAIPLLLIITGTVWYFFIRNRIRTLHN